MTRNLGLLWIVRYGMTCMLNSYYLSSDTERLFKTKCFAPFNSLALATTLRRKSLFNFHNKGK